MFYVRTQPKETSGRLLLFHRCRLLVSRARADVRFGSKADICTAPAQSALPPKADIRGPQSDVRMLIYAGRPVSKRVQAFRGATGGKANVDFDRLYFDCRNRRRDCDRNRSNLGSNFPRGQFARFLDVILRGARVWMASCGALDRAEARQARKTRKLILLTGDVRFTPKSGHVRRN